MNQPTANGLQVRTGARQSIPSSSIDSCAGVTVTLPPDADGHTKRPRSRRLANRHAPWPSHQIIFTKSPASTEHEQMPAIGIRLEHPFGLRREAREALAHVRHAARQPDPGRGWDRDHPASARTTRHSASTSNDPLALTR